MRRYMYEYGWEHGDFALFSVNAHANGAKNPFAHFQRPITVEQYKKAPMINAYGAKIKNRLGALGIINKVPRKGIPRKNHTP